jgi:molybdenum cofactor guanylyltransferase
VIDRSQITGLVLAGGRGSRMGGLDKGLQSYRGSPLALHAVRRLAPQVGAVAINANRNIDAYEAMGAPVWPDVMADYPGPLAGFLTGLERCETPWLVTVPCDSPLFPDNLVQRLAAAFEADATLEIAMAATIEAGGALKVQPVFCLLRSSLEASLMDFLHDGQRKAELWAARHKTELVRFDDAGAFANANTAAELQQLEAGGSAAPAA